MLNVMCKWFLFIFSASFILYACEEELAPTPIPYAFVNRTISLNNQPYSYELVAPGDFSTLLDEGVSGIILYKVSNTEYRAFEKYYCFLDEDDSTVCSTVTLDQAGLFMIDTVYGSAFDFNGNPTNPPANLPLLQYRAILQGNSLLTITN